jgi:hypothetical protein
MAPPRGRDRRGGLTAEPHRGVHGGSTPGPSTTTIPTRRANGGIWHAVPRLDDRESGREDHGASGSRCTSPNRGIFRYAASVPRRAFSAAPFRRSPYPFLRSADDFPPAPYLTCWIDYGGNKNPPDYGSPSKPSAVVVGRGPPRLLGASIRRQGSGRSAAGRADTRGRRADPGRRPRSDSVRHTRPSRRCTGR